MVDESLLIITVIPAITCMRNGNLSISNIFRRYLKKAIQNIVIKEWYLIFCRKSRDYPEYLFPNLLKREFVIPEGSIVSL